MHPIRSNAVLAAKRGASSSRRGARGLGRRRAGLACSAANGCARPATARGRRRSARPAAFRAESEARHLSAHGRRPVADGPLRLQAGDEGLVRQGPAGFDPPGPAPHHHDQRAEPLSDRALDLQVRAARQSGAWVSELLPYTAKMVDDIAIIRIMHTEAINHEPAITFIQTGSMIAGKPCIGSWIAYGLGSMNQDLPTFVVLQRNALRIPRPACRRFRPGCGARVFCRRKYAGVALRSSGDPVLYINNPDGVDRPGAPAHARRAGRAEPDAVRRSWAIRRRRRASRSMRWRSGCSPPCPS